MLPKLGQRPETREAAKRTMERLLEHTVREFEKLTYARNGAVNATQWRALFKAQASQNGQHDDQVTVYSERECGETSTAVAYKLQANATANASTLAALTPSAVLMAGRAPGKVESIMCALGGAHTQQGLALFAGFMYDGIADCGVLHALENDDGGDEETSCHFLGYKYVVKRSVASSAKLVRHRDMVYLDYTGYAQSSTGERLGFHIEHSVDVPGFPDLHDRNSSRVLQSVRYIFRQKSERVIEIYMLGNLELAGALNMGGAGGGDLFSVSKLRQCAETRRLTLMARRHRDHIEVLQSSSVHRKTECSLCHRTKRFFSGAMLAACAVCGQLVCSKCRNDKKLFVRGAASNDALGKFQRAQTCKTCVLAASAGCAPPPVHMSIIQQVAKNQDTDKASSVERDSICGRRGSSSSSSRASSTGERSDASGAESECHSYRQGPVYRFPRVDDEELRRQPRLDQLQQQETSSALMHLSETTGSHSTASNLWSSQMLERAKEHGRPRTRPGPQKREPPPPATSSLSDSISTARGCSGTSSRNSRASSDESNLVIGHRRGVYLTPPNPSTLYEEQQQRRLDTSRQHRRRKQTHPPANQLVVQNNSQLLGRGKTVVSYRQRQLARTPFEHGDRRGHELVTPYCNSYSGPSPAISNAGKTGFPHSERGYQRTASTPMVCGNSLMKQMMELNVKAESAFKATQRNGVFLQPRQW
ncbi:hypothetical protein PHYPSEUDO_002024 [Phytophthora pseudosyringae]|uniref:FYVE-type domain-containing protein n=1 Tax=Phytophthora pseudosyringae TaxID=221518 RepID=A0A8T1VU93_9STRA|nr:hypothetical protein PHYPSEUDO_002024 [Phytophthora pseudosyringae]